MLYSSSSIILIVELVFIGITFTLHLISLFSITKSRINADWLIFIVLDIISLLICHPIIVLIFPGSFVSYFFERYFYNTSRRFIMFDANRKLLTYILIMFILYSKYLIKVLRSLFYCTNLILL